MNIVLTHDNLFDVAAEIPPRILVVDDQPDHVALLIKRLANEKLKVIFAQSKRQAFEKLGEFAIDIALVDINLRQEEPRDRDGLYLAQELDKLAPEAQVVFISRPKHLDVDTALKMFNWREDLVNGRLAEAYFDKANIAGIVKMCLSILGAKQDRSWRVPLLAQTETWKAVTRDLHSKIGSVMETRGSRLVDGEGQCLQILRRLAGDHLMPLKEVRIDRVSHGRSRTIVLTTTAQYHPTGALRSTVVKIGDRALVQAERDNYVKWVPSFVRFAAYPEMTGVAASRQLAGIGYSMLGEPNDPAETFVDRYWGLAEEESLKILDDVFHSLLAPKQNPREESNSTMRQEYATRFQQLQRDDFQDAVERYCHHCKIGATKESWVIPVGGESRSVSSPMTAVDDTMFKSFWVSVVHGDLHGENIIVSKENQTFLIDFSHTGERHVFLDYVVMEVSVRMHLLRLFLLQLPKEMVQKHIGTWIEVEEWLTLEQKERKIPSEGVDGMEPLSRLARLVLWLRKNAWLHGYNDTYQNYYGALGMASLTSPFLPDETEEKVKYAVRRAMLSCAAFSLAKASTMADRRPLDDAMATTDSRDAFLNSLLVAGRFRIGQVAKKDCQALLRRLNASELQAGAESGQGLRQAIREEMPEFSRALDEHLARNGLPAALPETGYKVPGELVLAMSVLDSFDHPIVQSLKNKLKQWKDETFSRGTQRAKEDGLAVEVRSGRNG
ncbi:MAG: response regulator [Bryobacterales bacterium]|nr:response regulator [Bryobacterales bacterium]